MYWQIHWQLYQAALDGDVGFLTQALASKPPSYFLTPRFTSADQSDITGNIFHFAAFYSREEFIRVAVEGLPNEALKHLISQPVPNKRFFRKNPLHFAAEHGNLAIIKLFLDAYRSPPADTVTDHEVSPSSKPWLAQDFSGETPFQLALKSCHDECALEILSMDTDLLLGMPDNKGKYPLYTAVENGVCHMALKILASDYSCNFGGGRNRTVLHLVPECSGKVCRRLLEMEPQLLTETTEKGVTVLHSWVRKGKLWPFKCLFEMAKTVPNLRNAVLELLSTTEIYKADNPLHAAAAYPIEEYGIQVSQLLIGFYREERTKQAPNIPSDLAPWLAQNVFGYTPLLCAINKRHEKLASYYLKIDMNTLLSNLSSSNNALHFAISKGCIQVSEEIIAIVKQQGWNQLLTYCDKNIIVLALQKEFVQLAEVIVAIVEHQDLNQLLALPQGVNLLHVPNCTEKICRSLIEDHPDFLEETDENGCTVLHSWASFGKLLPLKLLRECDVSTCRNLIRSANNNGETPLHVAIRCGKQDFASFLVSIDEEMQASDMYPLWVLKDIRGKSPLEGAVQKGFDNFTLDIIAKDSKVVNESFAGESMLFISVQRGMNQVVQHILRTHSAEELSGMLLSEAGLTVLKVMSIFGLSYVTVELIMEKFWWLMDSEDLVEFNRKSDWRENFQTLLMQKRNDPSSLGAAAFNWLMAACERGQLSQVRLLIQHYSYFKNLCLEAKDTPLHHISLSTSKDYQDFLAIPLMTKMKNELDFDNKTPLHRALERQDIRLAEVLLTTDGVDRNIKDKEGRTAINLLEELCYQTEWDNLYLEIIPWPKTSYIEPTRLNISGGNTSAVTGLSLGEMRGTLSVVAALLATLTFAAGFTVPGGFNQDTGQAILAKKASFLVFVLADTYAMCCAMLVLFCLIWSMVSDQRKSVVLVDLSVLILLQSLYGTLVALMTGVFTVISHNSLWASILVLIMCSLVAIFANKTLLYKLLDKLVETERRKQTQTSGESLAIMSAVGDNNPNDDPLSVV